LSGLSLGGTEMFAAAALAVIATMALALARALMGPTVYDRVLAVNVMTTKTTLLIALLGFLAGRPEFLDIALVYALINFISVVAVLRLFCDRRRRPGPGQLGAAPLRRIFRRGRRHRHDPPAGFLHPPSCLGHHRHRGGIPDFGGSDDPGRPDAHHRQTYTDRGLYVLHQPSRHLCPGRRRPPLRDRANRRRRRASVKVWGCWPHAAGARS